MSLVTQLRPAQVEILTYRGGPMAISAVPGAGKTFVLTQLIARLVGDPELSVRPQQILVLTYMRGAATGFKRRAAQVLAQHGLTAYGLTCMTIHAFCLSVVYQKRAGGASDVRGGADDDPLRVYLDYDQQDLLERALAAYLKDPEAERRWAERWEAGAEGWKDPRGMTIDAARKVLAAQRNLRLSPAGVQRALADFPELARLVAHYEAQRALDRAYDFDALIGEAIGILETDEALRAAYQRQYRYVLEDEAQDSTPAQDILIKLLTSPDRGGSGNLVRVGDSNQAIMTSFTFNDPRFFRAFCASPGWPNGDPGRHVAMNESSRSALPILHVANALAESARRHPDPAVQVAFTGAGISQATAGRPNPPATCSPSWTVFATKDEEQLDVLVQARAYLKAHPTRRAAVLLYSGKAVHEYKIRARELGINLYDPSGRTEGDSKPVLALLAHTLNFLALPAGDLLAPFHAVLDARARVRGEKGPALAVLKRLAAQGIDLEALIYPSGLPPARPPEVTEEDYAAIALGARALKGLLAARHLPAAELLPAIAAQLLDERDAIIVAGSAAHRLQYEENRLAREERKLEQRERDRIRLERMALDPLTAMARAVAAMADKSGDRREILAKPLELSEPGPGQLEILTLHRSKGAEYDAVWLPGLGYYYAAREATFFPWRLDQAEIRDQLAFMAEQLLWAEAEGASRELLEREHEARCLTVAERLRLLYVGVTRAERELHLSCYHPDRRDPHLPQIEAMIAHCQRRTV